MIIIIQQYAVIINCIQSEDWFILDFFNTLSLAWKGVNKIETINRCERINMKCFENIIKEHCVSMKYLFLNFLMFKLIFLVENSKYLIEQGCHVLTICFAGQQTVFISSSYSTLFDFTWQKYFFSKMFLILI